MGQSQTADAVLLVRPAAFGFHAEAAASNAFATPSADAGLRAHATREVDRLARRLDDAGVEVLVLDDRPDPGKPDAVFPNNWVSFHADGTMALYPMATERRRMERETMRCALLRAMFRVRETVDRLPTTPGPLPRGTGSLILDRPRSAPFAAEASAPMTVRARRSPELGFPDPAIAPPTMPPAIYHPTVLSLARWASFAQSRCGAYLQRQ